MGQWASAMSVALMVGFAAGCATSGTQSYVPLSPTVNGVENHDLRVVLDSRIRYSVACPAIEQATTPDGRLEITAQLRDRENHPVTVAVNCIFKDADGREMKGEESAPQTVTLDGTGLRAVRFVAQGVERYTICVRVAKVEN